MATPAERRRICALLNLHGTVAVDPTQGVRLARFHRFRVRWAAVLPVRDTAREFVNVQTICISDLAGSRLPEAAAAPASE